MSEIENKQELVDLTPEQIKALINFNERLKKNGMRPLVDFEYAKGLNEVRKGNPNYDGRIHDEIINRTDGKVVWYNPMTNKFELKDDEEWDVEAETAKMIAEAEEQKRKFEEEKAKAEEDERLLAEELEKEKEKEHSQLLIEA